MVSDIKQFAKGLADLNLTEADCAVALMWFLDETGQAEEFQARDLAALLHDLSLRGHVNASRLAKNLVGHADVVRAKPGGAVKVGLSSRTALEERYEGLLVRKPVKVDAHVIDPEQFVGTRRYLEVLVWQINGTYQFAFYDACIVLCRRMIETLLIEAFEGTGAGPAIKLNNSYMSLAGVISVARAGQHIKLARSTGNTLEQIKEAGDTGAHSRTHLTAKADIDHLMMALRRVVSELAHLAKIEPSSRRQAGR